MIGKPSIRMLALIVAAARETGDEKTCDTIAEAMVMFFVSQNRDFRSGEFLAACGRKEHRDAESLRDTAR